MTSTKWTSQDVDAAFERYPKAVRDQLRAVRKLVLDTAREMDGVGPLTETLKWGEPAYLTEATGAGSTIRLGWSKAWPERAAIYFNCKTTLLASFRAAFPDTFQFEGDRAILLPLDRPIPDAPLKLCIGLALTYHQRKVRA